MTKDLLRSLVILLLDRSYSYDFILMFYEVFLPPPRRVSFRMTVSDLERLSDIGLFSDRKHCAVYLRQLSLFFLRFAF